MLSRSVWRYAFWVFFVYAVLAAAAFSGSGYHIVQRIRVPSGEATWDHSAIDEAGRRLFVAHENQVDVLNVDSGKLLGTIPARGAHAIALAPELKHGFITNGLNTMVTMFEFDTLKKLADIPTGQSPGAIVYDPFTRRAFSFSTVGLNSTVINAADGVVVATINLDAKPAQAIADGAGHVFVDLNDKSAVARIDAQALAVDQHWSIEGCDRPTTIDMDRKNHRLFIGCQDLMLYVVDSDNGRVISRLSVGENADDTAFDPATGLIFTSSGDGLISVGRQDGPSSYSVVDALYTKPGSKTMVLDLKTHRLFVPCGDLKKLPPAAPGGKARETVVPDTFAILVIGK
jgi:DNA-binding beta-propeller fold protein YncE